MLDGMKHKALVAGMAAALGFGGVAIASTGGDDPGTTSDPVPELDGTTTSTLDDDIDEPDTTTPTLPDDDDIDEPDTTTPTLPDDDDIDDDGSEVDDGDDSDEDDSDDGDDHGDDGDEDDGDEDGDS